MADIFDENSLFLNSDTTKNALSKPATLENAKPITRDTNEEFD